LIVDLIYEGGLAGMYYSVSDTAEYGGMTRGPQIIDGNTKMRMKAMLRAVQTGAFAKDWILENQAGRPTLNAYRQEHQELLLEKVGRELRDMMPWLKKKG